MSAWQSAFILLSLGALAFLLDSAIRVVRWGRRRTLRGSQASQFARDWREYQRRDQERQMRGIP